MSHLEVLHAGPGCLVEDLGRPGLASQGVTVSGAVDRRSLMDGNRLVGNKIGAPCIEALLGSLALRATTDTIVAVTGAWCPTSIDGAPVPFGSAVLLRAGNVLRLGRSERALRSYVAVRGGLRPPGAFGGSWSTDTSSGLGPAPVRVGDRLPIGDDTAGTPLLAQLQPALQPAHELLLRLQLGPRTIHEDARSALAHQFGAISSDSDRIGMRINGFQLSVPWGGASEAIPLGAVQAPPGGELIVFLADHPTTGGYPVVGVVDSADLDSLAQCMPGTRVRFVIRPTPTY